jgi:hypothetical protein
MTAISSAMNEVEGKVAIVTGAASGIGRSIAELLHARGAKVIAEDINPDVERLKRPGIVPLVADVAREDAAGKAVALTPEHFGKLDILVNNAARIMSKLVVDMTLEDWNAIMSVNVTGAFLHSREAMKAMIPNKSGAIVNIASYFAFPQISAYTSQGRTGAIDADAGARSHRTRHSCQRRRFGRCGDEYLGGQNGERARLFWPITAARRRSAAPPRRMRSPRSSPSWLRTGQVSSSAQLSWPTAA